MSGLKRSGRAASSARHWAALTETRHPRSARARESLRRFEQGRHVVFSREQTNGLRIVRILHERMLPKGHDLDDE
jgi:plasmid stabilization system protein ParE